MLPAFLFYSKQTIRLATVNNMFTDGKRHFSQSKWHLSRSKRPFSLVEKGRSARSKRPFCSERTGHEPVARE